MGHGISHIHITKFYPARGEGMEKFGLESKTFGMEVHYFIPGHQCFQCVNSYIKALLSTPLVLYM
jgi:hypothetical protein